MKKSSLRRADLLFSYVLMVLSVYMIVEAVGLLINPFGRDFDTVTGDQLKGYITKWYQSAGLMPFVLALIIMLLAMLLRGVALKDGAKLDFLTKDHFLYFVKLRETRVAVVVIAIFATYVFWLLPVCRANLNLFPKFQGFPFMIATFIFLAIQMIAFNERKVKAIVTSLIIAAAASGAITYGFGVLAKIPLP